jgi:hypothetical protein
MMGVLSKMRMALEQSKRAAAGMGYDEEVKNSLIAIFKAFILFWADTVQQLGLDPLGTMPYVISQ